MNWSLFAVIYIIAGTVTTGVVIIGTLIMGFDEIAHMQIAIVVGALASIPVTMLFAKKIGSITGDEEGYEA
ncbi:hypothetical protein NJD71_01295 [Psychrobacter sp. PP-21]|uniref:hypothetical protein n=1 Tax=Psychrobacter sp. PP-21 TaxID=2957503 RepID=UPI0029AD010F|nr:hypothetical protein [Psychrobacter sp. PP-21]MDX2372758.1 hypothetical protein [Psychrobacter sp. PP-21]